MNRFSTVVRRHRVAIVAAVLACLAAAALVAALQPRVYQASAVASVAGPAPTVEHMGPGIASRTAATYADVASAPIVLEHVIERLRLHSTEAALESQVHVRAEGDGPLIRVAVDDGSPTRAATIANAVVDRLIAATVQLAPQADASAPIVTVAQPAEPPTDPVTPNIPVDLTLGLLAGLVVAVVVVAALEWQRHGTSGRSA